ncbi:hypothetical protein C8J31_11425 [Rhizobium sp. PP-CC-2G-626]|nr:hypothetical protein C8J31_11425 [Rhizobium sp. PP-CC-2G-626]
MNCIAKLTATSLLSIFLSIFVLSEQATAKGPVEVAIGSINDQGTFDARGYGVIVRYDRQCLVVTLAHIASDGGDIDLADITARNGKVIASIEYVDHNENDDVYVGRIVPGNPLSRFCSQTEDLDELNDNFTSTLGGMLLKDFTALQVHTTPTVIDMIPRNDRTLNEAKRKEPIRYRLAKCSDSVGSDCRQPAQKDSGSIVSLALGGGDSLWLGLHQRQCRDACADKQPVWQAVSVMQIYAFITSPYSQLSAAIEQSRAATTGPDWRGSPEAVDRAREVRRTIFEWDNAFAELLGKLRVMNFPQESDRLCAPKCTIWQLRKFYGNELSPGALDVFKASFSATGPLTSEMLNVTSEVPTALSKELLMRVITTGNRLNDAIDKTQQPDRQLSTGEQMGWVVNGTPVTWIKFFQEIPPQYQAYVSELQSLQSAYCKSFKPTVELKLASSNKVFYGDLTQYRDPCSISPPWNDMIQGNPDFVLARLKNGF